ncbi:hypothetical protein CGK16_23315, partial [Vibrio parahaemolyticus]
LEVTLIQVLIVSVRCSFILHDSKKYNALLRGEQRNTEAAAYHLNHLNQRIVKMPRVANHS